MAEIEVHELYGGEVKIDYYPKKHWYKRHGKNEFLTSMTAATGVVDKSNVLIPWAVRVYQEYMTDGIAEIGGDSISRKVVEALIEAGQNEHRKIKDKAADYGTQVHDFAEQFALWKTNRAEKPAVKQGMPNEVLAGINAFIDWYTAEDITFVNSEFLVYSRKYDYVGRADMLFRKNGDDGLYLGDYKTSKGIYDDMRFQVAGYRGAYEEEHKIKLAGHAIFRFDKETGAFDEPRYFTQKDYVADLAAARHCVALKGRLKQLEKEYRNSNK